MVHLFQALRYRARERPDSVAHVVVDGPTLTFGAWHARACSSAGSLRLAGIASQVRVGLRFTTGDVPEAAVVTTAVQLLDAVPVLLPAMSDERELSRYRSDFGLDVVCPDDTGAAPLDGAFCVKQDCQLSRWTDRTDVERQIAAVVLSSGSTGRPKGVAITHEDLAYPARPGWSEEVLLTASATHTVDGATHLLAPLLDGRKVVSLPRFSAASFWRAVEEHEPTYLKLVPAMVRLLEAASITAPVARRAVRKIRVGSAAVTETDVQALSDLFPSAEIWMDYSSTESGKAGIGTRLDQRDCDRPRWRGELGVAGGDTFVRVVGTDGRTAPPGMPGEIQLRHAVLPARRYFPHDELRRGPASDDHWVAMGDLGVLDEWGWLWYRGRLAEMANCGGENVSLVEVEQAFLECEFVAAAAAAPLAHPVMGEAVGVLLVPTGDRVPAEADIQAFIRARLSPAQRPTRILWVSKLPMAEHGKIARGKVREALLNAPVPATRRPDRSHQVLDLVRARGYPEAEADDDLFALGLTSLDLLGLALDIEGEVGVTIDLGQLLAAPTIADLQRLVLASGAEPGA